jgi:FkbM family methyltransferase
MNIKKIVPKSMSPYIRLALHHINRYGRMSYSQEGEDILLARFIDAKKPGFYVDIGAHHPSRFSNTYYFYKRGWHGINIDAMPGSMDLFHKARPRDINLEIAIAQKKGTMEFHTFNEPLLNSGHPDTARRRRKSLNEDKTSINCIEIASDTLDSVLTKNIPKDVKINYMNVDVEGLDLEVLRSNDWSRFRPEYIVVESLGDSYKSALESKLCSFLESVGYEPMSKLVHTMIFRETSSPAIVHL